MNQNDPTRQGFRWWERSGRLALALWFIMPGVVGIAGTGLRYVRGDFQQGIIPVMSLVMGLVLMVAGGLAASGKLFLGTIVLSIDLAAGLLTLGGYSRGPTRIGGDQAVLLGVVFSAAGIAWVMSHRHRDGRRVEQAMTLLLLLAFAANAPSLGARFGGALGDLIAPVTTSRYVQIGERLPELRLVDLSGAPIPTSEEGVIYVLNFWATWCGPCRLELPFLMDMIEGLPEGAPVRLLGVNTEQLDRDSVEDFLEQEGLHGLHVCTDPDGTTDLLGTATIPLTIVIRGRTLLARHVGYSPETIKVLKRELMSYLSDVAPGGSGSWVSLPVP